MGEEFDVAAEDEHEAYCAAAEYIVPLLRLLPPAYAEPLRLADVEGLKQQDVAAQLGLGLSAAKSRIQRGRVLLKELFIECCLLETDAQGRLLGIDIRPGCRPLEAHRENLEKS